MRCWGWIGGAGLLAGIVLTLWLAGIGEREARTSVARAGASRETDAAREVHEVVPAAVPDSAVVPVVRPSGREAPEGEAVPHGRIRGRLFPIDVGGSLPAECIVILASAGNVLADTVRSDADGSFTSESEFPRGTVRAFVRDGKSGAQLARHEAPFDPGAEGEWYVPVVERVRRGERPVAHPEGGTWLRGAVVDLTARPVAGALVKGIPLDGKGEMADVVSDDSGAFELTGLEPGRYRVLVQGRFASATPFDLVLAEGVNEAGTVILPARPVAGAIEGRLVSDDGEDPSGVLLLRDLESGKERARNAAFSFFGQQEEETGSFAFRDVPVGRYELSLVALDGRPYEPRQVLVEPPASGLEFRARGPAAKGYRLRVRARESDQALGFFYALRLHGMWVGDDAAAGEDEVMPWPVPWIVWAEGRRPVRGVAPELQGDETEPHLIDVALEPGHAEVLLFKDVASDRLLADEFNAEFAPGLPGVSVWSRGRSIGTSDADGLVVLDSSEDPGELEFRHSGWRVLAEERLEGGTRLVQLVRE